jgi:hypothetical protein
VSLRTYAPSKPARRRGRPVVAAPLTHMITAALTVEQKRAAQARAAARGLTAGAYARALIVADLAQDSQS